MNDVPLLELLEPQFAERTFTSYPLAFFLKHLLLNRFECRQLSNLRKYISSKRFKYTIAAVRRLISEYIVFNS